jgi:two-component system NtrC family response regulator
MPLELQSKLLRALQERQIEPVGSSRPIPVNVRIIAATHQNLEKYIQSGDFRQDLYYRLNVVPLHIPPLRDRMEDIPLLVKHFLKQFGEPGVVVEADAFEKLNRHTWPGNVRELENAVERALALREHPERITARDIQLPTPSPPEVARSGLEIPEGGVKLDEVERQFLISALRKTGDNQTRAAELLGITRQKLIYRMHKYGIL